jgi:tetratricopeptide (TPR) repeat protein
VELVHSFLDYDLYIGAIGLTFWLIAGLIGHSAHDRRPPELELPPEPLPQRKKRGPRQPAPKVVTIEQGVHALSWPASGAGRAVVMVVFALGLCLTITPPLRNALAQNAMQAGDASYMAGLGAYDANDFMSMRNHFDTAFDDFRRATEFDPGWAAAWERYGVIMGTMGRGQEGEDAVRRASLLERTNFQPYMSMGRLYSEQASQETGSEATRQGLYEKAAEAYRQSLVRYPTNTRALRRLGTTYQQLGDMKSALDIYRRMERVENSDYNKYRALGDIDVDTEYAYAHYQLGRAAAAEYAARADRKALGEAMREFSAALGVVAAYQSQGKQMDEMFRLVGQPRENRSGDLQMLEGRTRFRLAALYQKAGDSIAAAKEVDRALTFYPGVADAVRREDGGQPEE